MIVRLSAGRKSAHVVGIIFEAVVKRSISQTEKLDDAVEMYIVHCRGILILSILMEKCIDRLSADDKLRLAISRYAHRVRVSVLSIRI